MRLSIKIGLISIFFIGIAAELFFKYLGFGDPPTVVLDEAIEYYVTPNSQFHRHGNEITTNEFGMRSESIADGDKVFILGDSVVYGNHFLDQGETISYLLPPLLRHPYSVYSVAASSWGPGNILAYVDKFGPFEGNYALIVQSSHDRFDVRFIENQIIPYRRTASYSATTDFIHAVYERALRRFFSQPNFSLSRQKRLGSTKKDLLQLISSLKQHFEGVVLFYHATQSELGQSHTEGSLHFQAIANSSNIGFISSLNFYANDCAGQDLYRDDIHLTREGSLCASRLISQWINAKQGD